MQCSGVAEIRGAAALITRLQAQGYPAFVCLLNPTDWGVASKNFPDIPRVYLPVDLRFVVRRWLRHIAPSAIVVVEAGIKPNFLAIANSSNPPIPAALVNARFSGCTTAPPILARKTISHIFRQIRCVLVRNEDDVKTFTSLGARASTVKVLGNLKYSAIPGKCNFPCPADSIPYVLAISTREGEEEIILEAWTAIPLKPLLVFIPRKPERVPDLVKTFSDVRELKVGLHSRDLVPNKNLNVYFVDTRGETWPWIQHAEFVFVGGSLLPQYGGQNILEPAALSRAFIVGPHTATFKNEVHALLEAGGGVQVTDRDSLQNIISRLLLNPENARRIGKRGHDHVKAKSDMAERYIGALHDHGVLPSLFRN